MQSRHIRTGKSIDDLMAEYANPSPRLKLAKTNMAARGALYGTIGGGLGFVASKGLEFYGMAQDLADKVAMIARNPVNLISPQYVQPNPSMHQQYWADAGPEIIIGAALIGLAIGIALKTGDYIRQRQEAIRERKQDITMEAVAMLAQQISALNATLASYSQRQIGPGYRSPDDPGRR